MAPLCSLISFFYITCKTHFMAIHLVQPRQAITKLNVNLIFDFNRKIRLHRHSKQVCNPSPSSLYFMIFMSIITQELFHIQSIHRKFSGNYGNQVYLYFCRYAFIFCRVHLISGGCISTVQATHFRIHLHLDDSMQFYNCFELHNTRA